ncbi:hypothetical protein [Paraflavitalea pollutisoli]|uniref:hypothetical protein n=1 Tax=Paraflavitalea pollutisoli TaxID=3034143 RepID=UPI0023EB2B4F|nr:hypothetical protein [Paraflavitalea sp. H1-2-19X]
MKKLTLIIEKADTGFLGRINYENNLVIDEAESLEDLEKNFRKLLKKYHGIDPKELKFEFKYDLSALFEQFSYLKISNVASLAGINASLLRSYVSGVKHASELQAKKIEMTIHKLGKDLLSVHVYGK